MFDTRIHDSTMPYPASQSYHNRSEHKAALEEAKRIQRETQRAARAERLANAILANDFVIALIGGAKRI
ncbi:hypothetical protein SDC9_151917 [bioreactor metagenome]|uniref:Uncharacterized protein n=1 Tax=bioreactor metagenome TaxID=1076179 RepID=A0A645ETX2_9ZZZZ